MITTRKGLILAMVCWLLIASAILPSTGTANETTIGPIVPQRPQGIMRTQLHNNLLWLIRGMQSANFTPDNVYFDVYNSVGSYEYPIGGVRTRTHNIFLARFINVLNQTINGIENDPTVDLASKVYLTNLYAEVADKTSLSINQNVDANLLINSTHDRKAVSIFYDHDRSVIEAFTKIANNETLDSQPFTGDEILTSVFMSLVRDEVRGNYVLQNEWQYNDGSNATLLKRFIFRLTSHEWLARELGLLFRLPAVNQMRTFSHPDINWINKDARVFKRGRFSVSQLQINELTLRKTGQRLLINDFDYKYIEHHLLGSLVYNDTNNNGYMDIGVKNVTIGQNTLVYPTIGDEALFRFDTQSIDTRTYHRPTTTNNVLDFGSDFTNVKGFLHPIERNQDITMFNESLSGLHTIDEVSTLFHFSVDNGTANLKFDYVLGEWDTASQLTGLSFNQLMASTVVDAKLQESIRWRADDSATEISDQFENASRVQRIRFSDSQASFGEIRLDDIPYMWDGTVEVNATGQLIPMNLIDFTYGQISSEADLIRGIRSSVQRKTFLYSVSYPQWDGKSITHDPTYAAVAGSVAGDGTGTAPIPGFDLVVAVIALPILAVIVVQRRKQR
ncbi:MAG: hypothetical protein ACFFE8_07315 [Candidatus Heimdallarchaeota archaeon]